MLTADDEHTYDPPLPTPGSTTCGGSHYAKAELQADGAYIWRCVNCTKTRIMRDGQGWR